MKSPDNPTDGTLAPSFLNRSPWRRTERRDRGVRCPSTEVSEHERVEVLVGPQDDTWFVWEARGTVDAPQCRTRSEVRGPSRRRTGTSRGPSRRAKSEGIAGALKLVRRKLVNTNLVQIREALKVVRRKLVKQKEDACLQSRNQD